MGAMEAVLPDGNEHLLAVHLHAYSAVDPAVKHSEGQEGHPNQDPAHLARLGIR